ncbi:Hypothetical predicted protein [Cloeon dipterum]|nr:Hypothetical predicted protein [Cloeon dipterum]
MDPNYISEEEEDDEEEDDEKSSDESSFESESDSQSQPFPTTLEPTQEFCYQSNRLELPQGLCESREIFNEFFSLDMWNNYLTSEQRTLLMKYLPNFEENSSAERVITLRRLFTGANFSFGNPLHKFFALLKDGNFTSKTERLKTLKKRVQAQECKLLQQRNMHATLRSLLSSKKHNPSLALVFPSSEVAPRLSRLALAAKPTPAEERTKRRYFNELNKIRCSIGEFGQSDDEIYTEGPPVGPSKKHKKQFSSAEASLRQEMPVIMSSHGDLRPTCLETKNPLDFNEKYYKKVISNYRKRKRKEGTFTEMNGMQRQRTQPATKSPSKPPPKRRKIKVEPVPSPAFTPKVVNGSIYEERNTKIKSEPVYGNGQNISAKPTANAKVPNRRRSSTKPIAVPTSAPAEVATSILTPDTIKKEKERVVPPPESLSTTLNQSNNCVMPAARMAAPVTPAMPVIPTLPDIAPLPPTAIPEDVQTSIDNNQILPNITFTPQEMEALELINMAEFEDIVAQITAAPLSTTPPVMNPSTSSKPEYELNQEMHVCFFTLVRDIICSTQDQRMGLPSLTSKLQAWQESPISPLNDWFGLSENWVNHLQSAINFLSGDFPAETQPDDFVPYLEYKPHMQAYQWIGAGRDSDHNLATLCTHWLERRNDVPANVCQEKESTDEPSLLQPPPPRCPTSWQVQPAAGAARELFHLQEKERYDNPNKAYTYRLHGFESVVGPLRGACATNSSLSKPRGHTLLVSDRPNCVTILSLVRDALARLPNGEGTRSDICILLRDSHYISPGAEENYLQSVVGGALDRLHYEADKCVKYDPKRKIWVYLHRNRTEEDFEKIYQQNQCMPQKSKRAAPRKSVRAPRTPKAKEPALGGYTIVHEPEKSAEEMDKVLAEVVSSLSSDMPATQFQQPQAVPAVTPKTQPQIKAKVATPAPPRQFAVAAGGTFQNVQIATSTGLQTIQIAAPNKGGGTSLLTTSAAKVCKAAAKKPTPASSPQTLLTKRTVVPTQTPVTGNRLSGTIPTSSSAAGNTAMLSKTSVEPTKQTAPAPLQVHQKQVETAKVITKKAVVGVTPSQMKLLNSGLSKAQQQNLLQQIARPQLQQQQQSQIVAAKTLPQNIKVLSNTVKGAPLMGSPRPQAVFIKQSSLAAAGAAQSGQPGATMPTLIMNKSGGFQVTSAAALKAGESGVKPMVTKLVATNSQGQLISLESLGGQKQLVASTSAGSTTGKSPQFLHVAAGSGGVPQLAVVSSGSVVRPRLAQPQQMKAGGIRLLSPSAIPGGTSGYNIASIGGQQVILASKPQTPGQNLFLTSGSGSNQTVVLASPSGLRPQGLVLQQGGAQQIVLPANLQGGNLNIKSLQNVQGIRVIPIAQAAASNANLAKGRQQVFARIISPTNRAALQANLAKSVEGTKGVDGAAE